MSNIDNATGVAQPIIVSGDEILNATTFSSLILKYWNNPEKFKTLILKYLTQTDLLNPYYMHNIKIMFGILFYEDVLSLLS
jgi:hypothetical protein